MQKFQSFWAWFVLLLLICIGGFWSSYFSRLLDPTPFTHHFHAVAMLAWVVLLIAQAWLIRSRKLALHRKVGKSSYILAPLVVMSGVSVALATIGERGPAGAGGLWTGLFWSLLFALLFGLAIRYRREPELHARYMATTGLVFLVPAFGRLWFTQLVPLGAPPLIGPFTIPALPLYVALLLMLWDRKNGGIRAPFVLFSALWAAHLVIWKFVLPDLRMWHFFAEAMAETFG